MKSRRFHVSTMILCAAAFLCTGCKYAPGRPGPEAPRPSQVVSFPDLYNQNCAACHGENGKDGAAISLGNPVYLSIVGVDKLEQVTANGIQGTLMPPFAKNQGGMLTDQQISVIAQGMVSAWGNSNALAGQNPPAYASTAAGNIESGQQSFTVFCANCHGADGTGVQHGNINSGSIVDPAYLALVSDQGLRSLIIAGQPGQGMPDWKSDVTGAGSRPMTDQEVTDIVAWLGSHRIAAPGQPYTHSTD